jgi:hypothetical protein
MRGNNLVLSKKKIFIGCCGAFCLTCREFNNTCRGCKIGYDKGDRNINRIRCEMKKCCFKEKKHETCADCENYSSCTIIQSFYDKKGYKYKKYKESIEFIRKYGYDAFYNKAEKWNNAYGRFS